VSFATAHNAMSNRDARWIAPNQEHGITRQLEDGVRGFMLDTYDSPSGALLCHGSCSLGKQPLSEGLGELEAFLAGHPDEVIGIIFESYVSAEKTLEAFEASGLIARVYAHPPGEPWPTLREMVARDERVIVMTDREGGAYPWYLDVWDVAWDNPYAAETVDDFTCALNRGREGNDLYILNRFLTNPVAYPALAEQANVNPGFIGFAERCRQESGQQPNWVTVDFYDIGDLLAVVDQLNGVTR
jgi:hypothetical protein